MNVDQRRIHPRRRLARSLIALVTVWCLGCDSIDPLLSAARAGGDVMDCDLAMPMADEAMGIGETVVVPVGAALSAPDDSQSFACDCQSCVVTAPEGAIVRAAAARASDLDVPEPARPASVTRTPLVPPPQRELDRA